MTCGKTEDRLDVCHSAKRINTLMCPDRESIAATAPAGKSEEALALPDFVEANFRGSEARRGSR